MEAIVEANCAGAYAEDWDTEELVLQMQALFDSKMTQDEVRVCDSIKSLRAAYLDEALAAYAAKEEAIGSEQLREIERRVMLSVIDQHWREHLYEMDSLRYSIGLRAHGQRDPLIEYKMEAFKLFDELMVNIKTEICHNIFRSASSMLAFENFLKNLPAITSHGDSSAYGGAEPPVKGAAQGKASDMVSEAAEAVSKAKPIRSGPKVGRNDPCPCGSGKKYKQCCGR